MQIAHDVPIA